MPKHIKLLGYKPSNLCHGIFKNMKILTKGKYSYSHEIYRQLMMSPPKNRIDIVPQAQIMVYELIHASQLYPKIQVTCMLPVRRSSDYPHRPATRINVESNTPNILFTSQSENQDEI